MTDIQDIPEDVLRTELKRRDEERAAEVRRLYDERLSKIEHVLQTPDGLKLLHLILPDHSRSSCDYSNPNSGRCKRCTVMQALQDEDWCTVEHNLRL